jgi:adenosylhomocysteine nucleosidase
MIVAIGSIQREAIGIIRAGSYGTVEAPEDFVAYTPNSDKFPTIVLSGSGSERAARATRWAIEEFSPTAVIEFGFCGATQDHARSGDIVIAARVIDLPGTPFEWSIVDETNSLGPDRTMLLAARTAVEIAGLDYHHGTLVTVSKVATTSGTKRWLGDAISATAVDTEAHAVAAAATKAGVPWAVVSAVLDDRDFNAPSIVDRLGSGPNERGMTAYIRHVSRKPLDLPALMQLGKASTRAGASLTTFMTAFMEALAAPPNVEDPPEST